MPQATVTSSDVGPKSFNGNTVVDCFPKLTLIIDSTSQSVMGLVKPSLRNDHRARATKNLVQINCRLRIAVKQLEAANG